MGGGMHVVREMVRRVRLERLETQVAALTRLRKDVANEAYLRLQRGQPVTRAQAAAFLGVSTKKLQRMEAQGNLQRCEQWGAVVKYSASDVLRLASASSWKGA